MKFESGMAMQKFVILIFVLIFITAISIYTLLQSDIFDEKEEITNRNIENTIHE